MYNFEHLAHQNCHSYGTLKLCISLNIWPTKNGHVGKKFHAFAKQYFIEIYNYIILSSKKLLYPTTLVCLVVTHGQAETCR